MNKDTCGIQWHGARYFSTMDFFTNGPLSVKGSFVSHHDIAVVEVVLDELPSAGRCEEEVGGVAAAKSSMWTDSSSLAVLACSHSSLVQDGQIFPLPLK